MWAGEGKADGTRPGSLLRQLACTPRPLFRSSLRASPFVTLSSPPHSEAAPRGSWTKHTEQGVTPPTPPPRPSSQRRRGTDGEQQGTSKGWSLRRRLLNKMGEIHITWSRGSRGQRALSSGSQANQPLLCLHGRQAKGGFYICKCLGKTKRKRVFHENPMKLKFQCRVKKLLGQGHTYSLVYRLWLLPCDEGRIEWLQRTLWPVEPRVFAVRLSPEKVCRALAYSPGLTPHRTLPRFHLFSVTLPFKNAWYFLSTWLMPREESDE